MVQGAPKKQGPKPGQKTSGPLKKGSRVFKPKSKKATKTANAKKTKIFSSGLIAKTEALLGERAGHLEIIGPGKKAKDGSKQNKHKGGTRKFG